VSVKPGLDNERSPHVEWRQWQFQSPKSIVWNKIGLQTNHSKR